MQITPGSKKSRNALRRTDMNSPYSDSVSKDYIIDHKWNLVITHYDGNKYHVSVSTMSGQAFPSRQAITYISQLGLFPHRERYMLYTAGTKVVHFDITE